MKKLISVLLLACLAITIGCARLPKEKSVEKMLTRYFNKYSHKYKTSDFGGKKVEETHVLDVQEMHKDLAAVLAEIKMRDGPIFRIRAMIDKKSLGWKVESWEKL